MKFSLNKSNYYFVVKIIKTLKYIIKLTENKIINLKK